MEADDLRGELRSVAADAERRRAAVDATFQTIFDDWCEGRGYHGLSTNQLVERAVALVDETDPEPASAVEHRQDVMGDAAQLYLSGGNADRQMLEAEVGGSKSLVWAMKDYLAAPVENRGELARRFAAAAMLAGAEDYRDLLVRLVQILDEAARRGIPTDGDAARVEALAGPSGADLFRRLRERDPAGW